MTEDRKYAHEIYPHPGAFVVMVGALVLIIIGAFVGLGWVS